MTKFIQKKELTAMEELWVRPFKHLQFYYVSSIGGTGLSKKEYNSKNWRYKTFFTDVHEAIKHHIEVFGSGVEGHRFLYLYTLLPNGLPIKNYKMSLINPQDDLSMSCEIYEPVLFQYCNMIEIIDVERNFNEVKDFTYIVEPSTKIMQYWKLRNDGTDLLDIPEKVSPARKGMMKEYNRIYKDAIESMGSSNLLQVPDLKPRPVLREPVLQLNILKNRNEKGEN